VTNVMRVVFFVFQQPK